MWCFLGTITKEERDNMGLRFRKGFKIAPGVKFNLNKKSSSITFGGKGVHYTVSSTGKKTASVGIPGIGISYTESIGRTGNKTAQNNKDNQFSYSQPNAPDPQHNNDKKKWYQSTLWIILWLILFFPVGLFLMWKYSDWKKPVKFIVTVFFAFAIIGATLSPETLESATLSADTSKTYDIKQEIRIKSTLTPSDYDIPDSAYKASGGELRITDGNIYFQADKAGTYEIWVDCNGIESNKLKINIEDKAAIAKKKAEEEAKKKAEEAKKAEEERLAAEKAEQERLAAEQAEQERLAAEQAEQERLAAEQAAQEQATIAQQNAEDPIVYITNTGSKYHNASCRTLKSKIEKHLSEVRGVYEPCGICHPPQ